MDFLTITFQVISLFVMMAVGFAAKKLGYMTNEVKRGMTDILIKIITPAVIISSFSGALEQDKIHNAIIVLVGAMIAHIILCVISLLLYKKESDERRAVLRFTLIFGNFGFMGFPVLQSIFGLDGVFYGAMFTAAFYLFSWTFGVSLFSRITSVKDTLKAIFNPPLIAVILGFLMYISPFRLPSFIQTPVDAIGSMNTPFSMLIVGSIFADVKPKDIFTDSKVYLASALRLVAAPLLMLGIVLLINLTGLVDLTGVSYEVIVIEECMPCAAYCAIFATKFGGDAKFASKIVAIATALSILTIPLFIQLISFFGI